MVDNHVVKTPKTTSKSFLAVGPTLHYSHQNVQRCWLFAFFAFGASCLFWSKMQSGLAWSFDFGQVAFFKTPQLAQSVISGLSIFEYPWQILVLGLLMGILGVVPVLVSQLMSFSHSLPFVFAVVFLANLPTFGICLLVSCIAVACRPLRFRSRFIAIALCTAPQFIFLGVFGGAKGIEPIRWGFSFTPWVCAWLVGLLMAAAVLGIGHFTRYRPGLIWITTAMVFVGSITVFQVKVGFDELDYQLYVAKNNPEQAVEFYDHSVTEALDDTLTDPAVKRYLAGFFYPTEPILLRAELKKELQIQLAHDRWPSWFMVPDELKFMAKKRWLFEQYDLFIKKRPRSRRMPVALYYKALLSEYNPDVKLLGEKEVLHFYSDYPHEDALEVWYELYGWFPDSPESLEARWRIAKYWSGQGKFERADKIISFALSEIERQLKLLESQSPSISTLFSPFQSPRVSVMSKFKLSELQRRLNHLRSTISGENRTGEEASLNRLARFVMLNPHSSDYTDQLNDLLGQIGPGDPLRDNILLAQRKMIADERLRAEKLAQLHNKFQDTDGGIEALYELGLLKIRQWRNQDESNVEQKKKYLAQARTSLTNYIKLYPDSCLTEQVGKNLAELPKVD